MTVDQGPGSAAPARVVDRLLVVGAGAMGRQIALLAARTGLTVDLVDVSGTALRAARAELDARQDREVARGRATQEAAEAALGRLHCGTDLEGPARHADLVVEAVVERLDVKRELFARLDAWCPPWTILASNSSSIVPSRLASATKRPDRVVNVHFFNPALVMACVEVVRGPETDDRAVAAAVAFAERLGKRPVVLDREIFGFVANRILSAVRDEAVRLVEGGYASVEAVDAVCRDALGYPMGPFELMDLTGVDIGHDVKRQRFAETGDPADAPAASVVALVAAGELGRKTGRGWYRYDGRGVRSGPNPTPLRAIRGTPHDPSDTPSDDPSQTPGDQ